MGGMAIMAAEAAEGAGTGAARAFSRAGRRGYRALPRTPGPSQAVGRHARSQGTSERVRRSAQDRAVRYGREQVPRQARYVAQQAQITPGDRAYQPVILAEFIAAALLVTLAPIAQPSSGGTGSPSPYDTNDLKQLVGIGAVYFVLALVASGNHGRLAAWFGGLILIAIGMGKLPGGQLKAIFSVVGQGPSVSPGSTQVA